jgi:uncharacterized protein
LRSIPFEKLSIPLSEIKEGISHFVFRVEDSNLAVVQGRSFPNGIEVNTQFTVLGNDYLVKIEAKGECALICDRCGESIIKLIIGEVQTLYTFDRLKLQETNSDDIHLLSSSEKEIDIRQDVFDSLILALPTKVICREDCLGLCPHCGVNLNKEECRCSKEKMDPRWNGLKNVKLK